MKEYLFNLHADGAKVRRARAQLAGIAGGCTGAPLLCHVHALLFVANASWIELEALCSALGIRTPGWLATARKVVETEMVAAAAGRRRRCWQRRGTGARVCLSDPAASLPEGPGSPSPPRPLRWRLRGGTASADRTPRNAAPSLKRWTLRRSSASGLKRRQLSPLPACPLVTRSRRVTGSFAVGHSCSPTPRAVQWAVRCCLRASCPSS